MRRSGHLFQGRYGVRGVDAAAGLLEVSRYVLFNPVTAGLVKQPEEWKYSSFRGCRGETPCALVNVEPLLAIAGGRDQYLRFLEEYDPSDPDSALKYVVSNEFEKRAGKGFRKGKSYGKV